MDIGIGIDSSTRDNREQVLPNWIAGAKTPRFLNYCRALICWWWFEENSAARAKLLEACDQKELELRADSIIY